MAKVWALRMQKEVMMLEKSPPYGISAWPRNDALDLLEAVVTGPEDTPYEGGLFELEINIPESYPNEPPKVRFITPVYHPNIDNSGRICLDSLKMPPKGAWTPSLNISTLLITIRVLLANPNPDDPLMPDITEQYIHHHSEFSATARAWTRKHACKDSNKPTTTVKLNQQDIPPTTTSTWSNNTSSERHNTKAQPQILHVEDGDSDNSDSEKKSGSSSSENSDEEIIPKKSIPKKALPSSSNVKNNLQKPSQPNKRKNQDFVSKDGEKGKKSKNVNM